jgi:hypothetical protein
MRHNVSAGSDERDLRRTDVRRFLDHLLDGERTRAMRVVDRVPADRELARSVWMIESGAPCRPRAPRRW